MMITDREECRLLTLTFFSDPLLGHTPKSKNEVAGGDLKDCHLDYISHRAVICGEQQMHNKKSDPNNMEI